jgi:hypothetical protein
VIDNRGIGAQAIGNESQVPHAWKRLYVGHETLEQIDTASRSLQPTLERTRLDDERLLYLLQTRIEANDQVS